MFKTTEETRPVVDPNAVIQLMLEQLAILKLMHTGYIYIPGSSGITEDDIK